MIGGSRGFPFAEGEEVLLFLRPVGECYYEVHSKSGELAVVEREDGTYFDTSRLKGNEEAAKGASLSSRAAVLSHVSALLAERSE